MEIFNDDEYYDKIFGKTEDELKANLKQNSNNAADIIKRASDRATDIRKFETNLFWERGKYYWAFILAAFTAHFYLLNIVLKNGENGLSLKTFMDLPVLALFSLAITAFVCFFFCFTWTLMNKGSKFWQKNWEQHVNKMEKLENSRLFSTYLNPNDKDYKKCPLKFSAYDYSVSKLVLSTSILLMVISFGMFIFYIFLTMIRLFSLIVIFSTNKILLIVITIISCLIVVIITYSIFRCITKHISGNHDLNNVEQKKWYQADV